jgi:hypothetical protein
LKFTVDSEERRDAGVSALYQTHDEKRFMPRVGPQDSVDACDDQVKFIGRCARGAATTFSFIRIAARWDGGEARKMRELNAAKKRLSSF